MTLSIFSLLDMTIGIPKATPGPCRERVLGAAHEDLLYVLWHWVDEHTARCVRDFLLGDLRAFEKLSPTQQAHAKEFAKVCRVPLVVAPLAY